MSILAIIGLALFCVGGIAVGLILLVLTVGEAWEKAERKRR